MPLALLILSISSLVDAHLRFDVLRRKLILVLASVDVHHWIALIQERRTDLLIGDITRNGLISGLKRHFEALLLALILYVNVEMLGKCSAKPDKVTFHGLSEVDGVLGIRHQRVFTMPTFQAEIESLALFFDVNVGLLFRRRWQVIGEAA